LFYYEWYEKDILYNLGVGIIYIIGLSGA
jgi:hypothetical protein